MPALLSALCNIFKIRFLFSDETFYTQSQIIVEKVPEFLAESLCLRQGMVTSGRCSGAVVKWPVVTIPLTKAERFCRKFGNFFHLYFDSVYKMSHQKLCFQSPKAFTPKKIDVQYIAKLWPPYWPNLTHFHLCVLPKHFRSTEANNLSFCGSPPPVSGR